MDARNQWNMVLMAGENWLQANSLEQLIPRAHSGKRQWFYFPSRNAQMLQQPYDKGALQAIGARGY